MPPLTIGDESEAEACEHGSLARAEEAAPGSLFVRSISEHEKIPRRVVDGGWDDDGSGCDPGTRRKIRRLEFVGRDLPGVVGVPRDIFRTKVVGIYADTTFHGGVAIRRQHIDKEILGVGDSDAETSKFICHDENWERIQNGWLARRQQ